MPPISTNKFLQLFDPTRISTRAVVMLALFAYLRHIIGDPLQDSFPVRQRLIDGWRHRPCPWAMVKIIKPKYDQIIEPKVDRLRSRCCMLRLSCLVSGGSDEHTERARSYKSIATHQIIMTQCNSNDIISDRASR
eukprot:2545127-Amphidinium_carterae.1